MPHVHPGTPARATETPPALSGRTLRRLRQVNELRTLRRGIAALSALCALVLAATFGLSAMADQAPKASAPQLQTLAVPAAAVHQATTRDSFTLTVPPPLQWPVNPRSRIADGFGPRVAPCDGCSSFHEGVDFDAGYGARVHAIAAGVVVETNNPRASALGVHAVIQHLIDGRTVTSVYGHMQRGSLRLAVGDIVAPGQVIGLVGSTGASTGAHLHFELHVGNRAVDPLAWMHARLG